MVAYKLKKKLKTNTSIFFLLVIRIKVFGYSKYAGVLEKLFIFTEFFILLFILSFTSNDTRTYKYKYSYYVVTISKKFNVIFVLNLMKIQFIVPILIKTLHNRIKCNSQDQNDTSKLQKYLKSAQKSHGLCFDNN